MKRIITAIMIAATMLLSACEGESSYENTMTIGGIYMGNIPYYGTKVAAVDISDADHIIAEADINNKVFNLRLTDVPLKELYTVSGMFDPRGNVVVSGNANVIVLELQIFDAAEEARGVLYLGKVDIEEEDESGVSTYEVGDIIRAYKVVYIYSDNECVVKGREGEVNYNLFLTFGWNRVEIMHDIETDIKYVKHSPLEGYKWLYSEYKN